jgi:UDP:flavonoid glycosyltransferase YjiC (YdhE family)
VVPFGRDQLDVARHVEVAGAGAGVSPARLTAARLREAVVLARSRRAGAQRVARAFAEAGGAAACVAALEALVRGA